MNRISLVLASCVAFSMTAAESLNGALFFADSFNYANGDLTDVDKAPGADVLLGDNVSNSVWNDHSGSGQVDSITIIDGKAELITSGSEDANRTVADPVNGALSGGAWYFAAQLTVNDIRPTPVAEGVRNEYFIHFKDSTTSGFVTRVYLADPSTGVGGDGFRFGLAATTGGQTDVWGSDLAFGETYKIVGSYNFDTGVSELWVNPVDAASTKITSGDGDATGPGTFVNALAIRQAFIGAGADPVALPANRPNTQVLLDAVAMGDSFGEVLAAVPEPASGALALCGVLASMLLGRRRS